MVHWRANDVRIARRSTQTDQVQYMLACTYIQAGVHTYRPIAHAGMHIHPLESHFTSCPHEVHTGAHIHGRMHTHTQTYTCIAYVHTYKTHTNKEGIPQCITYIHIHAIQYTHTSYMRYNILTYIQTITHTIHTYIDAYIQTYTQYNTYNTHIHTRHTYKTYIHNTHVYVCHVMSCMYVCHVM